MDWMEFSDQVNASLLRQSGFQIGETVLCNGRKGILLSGYAGNMCEVRLECGGDVCVDFDAIKKLVEGTA